MKIKQDCNKRTATTMSARLRWLYKWLEGTGFSPICQEAFLHIYYCTLLSLLEEDDAQKLLQSVNSKLKTPYTTYLFVLNCSNANSLTAEITVKLAGKYYEQRKSITQKGKHYDDTPIMGGDITAWDKNTYAMIAKKPKEAFLADCMSALQESITTVRTQQEFCDEMKKRGWDVIWEPNRKHITFVDSDGKKVRDSKLSKLFNAEISKESLTRHFSSAAERQHKRHKRHR